MSDKKPPEQMTLEELELAVYLLLETPNALGVRMEPDAKERLRPKCEANPYLKLLREGAVIEVEKTEYDYGYFRVNGEDVEISAALYEFLLCPQIRSVYIEAQGWRFVIRYILADAPTPEDAFDGEM